MQELVIAVLGILVGAAAGALLVRGRAPAPAATAPVPAGSALAASTTFGTATSVDALVRQLPGCVLQCRSDGSLLWISPDAERLRLNRRGFVAFDELGSMARSALMGGHTSVASMTLWRPPLRKGRLDVRVRAIPLDTDSALLLLDDLTAETRVADVRRDFIANVSHELKTPVGAMSLLAEAVVAASDDPASVAHFAGRMQVESQRLTNLINDVIDLSRLQGEDPLLSGDPVALDEVVADSLDFIKSSADAKNIELVVGGERGVRVIGVRDQLTTALCNLLSNAVAYSAPHTRVAIAIRTADGIVDVAVKDQGIGIPEAEQGRIFERFYRVDSARSRVTGGTGLGLAIVRNVCRNHGGDVTVWSVANEGATFTMHLPLPEDDATHEADDDMMEGRP